MILAIDTSIGTSVAVVTRQGEVLAERASEDTRGHAESIGRLIATVLEARPVITAVAAGVGPGPFTGLRVGIAAARAFGFGRGIPVLGVLSHDAIAVVEWGDGLLDGVAESWLRVVIERPTGAAAADDEELDGPAPRRVRIEPHGPRWAEPGARLTAITSVDSSIAGRSPRSAELAAEDHEVARAQARAEGGAEGLHGVRVGDGQGDDGGPFDSAPPRSATGVLRSLSDERSEESKGPPSSP